MSAANDFRGAQFERSMPCLEYPLHHSMGSREPASGIHPERVASLYLQEF